jgi:hypothetical protein
MATLTEIFDESASWHTPGRSPLAGDCEGREAVFAHAPGSTAPHRANALSGASEVVLGRRHAARGDVLGVVLTAELRRLGPAFVPRFLQDRRDLGVGDEVLPALPIPGFAEPSDGLEPSTPSLPCTPRGNRSQPTATVLACFCRSFARAIWG